MTFRKNMKAAIKVLLPVLAFICIIFFLCSGLLRADDSMNSKMTEALRRSIIDGAAVCYSVEGAYPENVAYLVENYGVKYDESRYIVHYQYFAANIKPDVVIIEKEQ